MKKGAGQAQHEIDTSPDDGREVNDTEDGRGPEWRYGRAPRCTAPSRQRTKAARAAGLIGPDEVRRCRKPCEIGVVPKNSGKPKCRWHGKPKKGAHGTVIKTDGHRATRLGKFRDAYIRSMDSPTQLDVRDGIALLDAVLERCLERADQLDTPNFRKRALEHFDAAQAAMAEKDTETAAAELSRLGRLLRDGGSEDDSLRTLISALETRQTRIENAWKIKLRAEEVMNVRDLTAVFSLVGSVIFEKAGEELGSEIMGRIDALVRGFGTRKKPIEG